ncbi:uncharacterized protein LOC116224054 [Clupea harengus]|uniref:Uncharacterized protein LOC116224054 n=1 Tax=Clupea harengus TaxID=7950 RepID=A0A6P8GLK6_CLUHA|nr:uncharacterized protein LOC116224054 [Clupea harengus]
METVIEEELNKVTMANDTTQQRCLDLGGLPGYAEWPTLVEEAKRGVKIWTVKFEPEEQLNLNGPLYTVKIDPEEEELNLNAVKIEPEEEQLNLNGPLGTVKIEPPEEEQLNLNAVKIEPEEEQLNLNAVKIESEEEQLNLNGPFSEGKSSNEARAPDETKTTGTGPNLPGEQDEPQKIKIEVVESLSQRDEPQKIKIEVVESLCQRNEPQKIKIEVVESLSQRDEPQKIKIEVVESLCQRNEPQKIKIEVVESLCQRDEDSISSNYTLSVFPSDEEDEEDALVIECDWRQGRDVVRSGSTDPWKKKENCSSERNSEMGTNTE